jgi:hypothetical protein
MRVFLAFCAVSAGLVLSCYAADHVSLAKHRYAIVPYNYGAKEGDSEPIKEANQLLQALALDVETSIANEINLDVPDASYLQSFTISAPQFESAPMSIGDVKKRWIEQNILQIIQATALKHGDEIIWDSSIYIGSLGSNIKKEQIRLQSNINGDDYKRASEQMKLIVLFSLVEDALNLPSSQSPVGQTSRVVCGLIGLGRSYIINLVELGVFQRQDAGSPSDPVAKVTTVGGQFEVGPQIVGEMASIRADKQCP